RDADLDADGAGNGGTGEHLLPRRRPDHLVAGATCAEHSLRRMTNLNLETRGGMAKRWYIVQAYSNFERKVAEDIRQKVAQKKLDALFEDVIVPTEKVVEMRRGRKVDAE